MFTSKFFIDSRTYPLLTSRFILNLNERKKRRELVPQKLLKRTLVLVRVGTIAFCPSVPKFKSMNLLFLKYSANH